MKTNHSIFKCSSSKMRELVDGCVNLTITSPPYPMIQMWDDMFSKQNIKIKQALFEREGDKAFELMHQELDLVWNEVYRVTAPGGIVCINIGDATRNIDNHFKLYPNHSRITNYMTSIGFSNLPNILWVKQTNAPNKFMGSGMLPSNAYVTLENEHILIFRKGNKRLFKTTESKDRKESAYFWEERNE